MPHSGREIKGTEVRKYTYIYSFAEKHKMDKPSKMGDLQEVVIMGWKEREVETD